MTINQVCNCGKPKSPICPMSPLVISLLVCQSMIKIMITPFDFGFASYGISRSVAINMFYRMVILKKGLPWQPDLDETEYIKQNPKLFE